MSSNSTFSFTSSSSHSSSSTVDGQTTASNFSVETAGNPQGSTVRTTSQNLGEDAVSSTKSYDAHGRELLNGGTDQRVVEKVTDADADKRYEEAMEDEYAKREGGA